MATAKRVKQDPKEEITPFSNMRRDYRVTVQDGQEVDRQPFGGPYVSKGVRVTTVPQPDRIVLEMSVEEAETLAIIGWATGGSPDGRRGAVDRIKAALKDAGVSYWGGTRYHPDLQTPLRFGPDYTPLSPTASTQASPIKDADKG